MITIITNRKIVANGDLISHLKKCSHSKIKRIIFREKDLPEIKVVNMINQIKLSKELKEIPILVNGPYDLLNTYGAEGRHYTYSQYLCYLKLNEKKSFKIGVSVHSLEEVLFLNNCEIDYIMYGHIFETKCKEGVKARGLENLRKVVDLSKNPVIALGGIDEKNYRKIFNVPCIEIALMSSLMSNEDPTGYIDMFHYI